MPGFLLIHGAYCQGWIWAETAAALREDGHRVEVADLPSDLAARIGQLAGSPT